MNKSLLIKIGVAALLLAGFAGYNAYTKWNNTHFTVDPESFDIVNNMQNVMADDFEKYPPLKLAYQYDLLESVNQSVTLPELHRRLTIQKIWFLFPRIYVLYSLNLHKNDENPKKIPHLNFSSMVLQSSEGITLKGEVKHPNGQGHPNMSGTVYNHKLYRGIFFVPHFNNPFPKDFNFGGFLENLETIRLKKAVLLASADKKTNMDPADGTPVDNLEVAYHYDPEKNVLFDVPLNKKVGLNNGHTLTFKKLEAHVQGTKLFFSLKPDNKQYIYSLYTKRNHSNKSFHLSGQKHVFHTENQQYAINFRPINELNDELRFELTGIGYLKNKVKFTVPASLQADKQKVAEIFGNSFYFSNYLEQPENMVALQLKWEEPGDKEKDRVDVLSEMHPRSYKRLQKILGKINNKQQKELIRRSFTGAIEVQNENGKHPDEIDVISKKGTPEYNYLSILLNKSYLKNSKQLTIIVRNVPYVHRISPKTIHINIPDKGYKGK